MLGERSATEALGCGELDERSELLLAFARVLYVNGQATDQMLAATAQLANVLGLRLSTPIVRWGELHFHVHDGNATHAIEAVANPSDVNMARVSAAMRVIDELAAGSLTVDAASRSIRLIAKKPPAPTLLFMLAAASGAVALAIIFGIEHLTAAVLIGVSAAIGAALRRGLARYTTNLFVQPLCAALLAGIIGGLAVRYQVSSSLRLVSVCPCMILVPGPHLLNAAMDFIKGRIHLGAARGLYAVVTIVAISTGLLLGLAVLGTSLPVDPPGRSVPLWQDAIAAGVAVASYSIFFSTPLQMLPWPVAVGMLGHVLRWIVLLLGASTAMGAFIACLIVGLVLTPVSRRSEMPFAAIGFASVVSMMPGVFIFRMASGLVQLTSGSQTTLEVIRGTIADGVTATTVILAMGLGLIVPKLLVDYVSDRSSQTTRETI
jgi:uncharacterized membrane protein YjjP (DUF1212 family)